MYYSFKETENGSRITTSMSKFENTPIQFIGEDKKKCVSCGRIVRKDNHFDLIPICNDCLKINRQESRMAIKSYVDSKFEPFLKVEKDTK